jgi:predicted Ser/Thr protein kinase
MYACGRVELPQQINCKGKTWELEKIFKHDFFACTGRYLCEQTQERIVLKIGRLQSFLGIPCAWIGRFLRNREIQILKQLQDIDQFPNIIKLYGRNGVIYRYIEGKTPDEKPSVPDDFFDQLQSLLETIHQRNICYLDMNKRGNILVGQDGRPYVIDFQISMFLSAKWCRRLRETFQKEDFYHLLKHKRKLRPDLLTEEEHIKQPSILIRLHRIIAYPFQKLRRPILRFLYQKDILNSNPNSNRSPENNPDRFLR